MRLGCEDMLASGAVITGGATQLPGMAELAEEVLGIPVRLGMPKGVGGLADVVKSPAFSTGVGLVQYGASQQSLAGRPNTPARSGGIFSRLRRVLSSAF
jgi:cell division protein FtsA